MKSTKFITLLTFLLSIPFLSFSQDTFSIAFGSCNNQKLNNPFWENILSLQPDVWIWGGDNIYADTNNMRKMKRMYKSQKKVKGYKELTTKVPILATWDDHDYGKNDAGVEFEMKDESQQLFLDFLDVPKNSPRRKQRGVYHSKTFNTKDGSVKIIVLDTRYFRTSLTRGTNGQRFQPNKYNEGTILGDTQWKWLTNELTNSTATFTIIVSSIQILSKEHGFEKWGNFPHEVANLFSLIKKAKNTNVILLSGDRHISEFSKTTIEGLAYPLIDFTSSGLTHAYSSFSSEENNFRIGNVVNSLSYGTLLLDLKTKKVTFQMRGKNKSILQEINQVYP
ncbi:alkaline phosphatase D [Tenacibaculum mesophilum]|uniref:Alkaline phosphatase family protein n=1 Tax=Tenacibaculum mesophilum TaxID=104268 RepID=A0ABM7CEJ6_9FLAO|nr:alkaline phosphatase D family protein [Tenacibaculum mesophilum]AZJ32169.1 alkaline phosphatase family protein [Tenacibaculum mesophilum]QFS27427.1 alkaline phosphatase family protein [Tenacibaculum mesophilum]SHG18298.1 alkaline phosphatase D [Tenacibaculum mesophilum]